MGFTTAIRTCLSKYATFSGRARRPEYWWFILFVILGSVVFSIVDGLIFGFGMADEPETQIFQPLFGLAMLLPSLAAGWRRMHDTGRPGWYVLIPTIVSIAGALLLMFGAFGMGAMGAMGPGGMDPGAMGGAGALAGLGGLLILAIVQIVSVVLLIVWLTRPSQPGPNEYGPEPEV
ncbi:DUF805 domain-containing protein [Rhodobacterales bacterium HKCCE3408]|nr:DUF805 domain-containing protein [Rhodobacterales bacterium HKCCE3408]